MLRFLSCYFSLLNCSVTMPVSSVELAATYTPFTKWCSRATPTRRSRLHEVLWNAERLVLLMSDVKATTSLCSLQYVSWTTKLKRPDQRTFSRTRTDITWQKVQTEVMENAKIKKQHYRKGEGREGGDIQLIARSASVTLNLPNMTFGFVWLIFLQMFQKTVNITVNHINIPHKVYLKGDETNNMSKQTLCQQWIFFTLVLLKLIILTATPLGSIREFSVE